MSEPSRILLVVPGPLERLTGGSIYDSHIAECIRRSGFHLDVVTLPDLPYLASLIIGPLISARALFRLLRAKVDVVIEDAWTHPSLLLFNLVCGLRAKPTLVMIVHQIRWREARFPKRVARVIERTALMRSGLIIAVSRFIKQEIEDLGGKSLTIAIARPGCDGASRANDTATAAFAGSRASANPLRLLFVGRCTRRKGLEDLIKAMALVKDMPLVLDVAGRVDVDPGFFRKLRQFIGSVEMSGMVTFHGLLEPAALTRLYSAADIFVFPSHYEGYGIVLAEAMKAGLPIIAADNGPANEIVADNENGFVVPPRNPAALAGAIKRLAEDSAMRERFARRSRELSEALPSWSDTCDVVRDEISACLSEQPGNQSEPRTESE